MADLLEELESPRDLAPLPEEEGEEEEESFGSRTAKGRGAPRGPTEKERAEHNLTHLPYRSWCPACVAGRGLGPAHPTQKELLGGEVQAVVVCCDFRYPERGPKKKGGRQERGKLEQACALGGWRWD